MPYTDEERNAHDALQEYSALRITHAAADGERMAAEFVLKLLKKRLFSSPAAFGITLEKHIATVGGRKAASTATRDIEDFSDDYADDDEYEAQTGEVVSSVSQALSPVSAEEKVLLRQLSEYAAKTSQRPDCKAQTLIDWLKTACGPAESGMTSALSSLPNTVPHRSGFLTCSPAKALPNKGDWR